MQFKWTRRKRGSSKHDWGRGASIDIQDRWIGTNSSIKSPLLPDWRLLTRRTRAITRWQLIKALSKLICGAPWPAVCKVGMRRVCHAEWVTDRVLNWDGRTTIGHDTHSSRAAARSYGGELRATGFFEEGEKFDNSVKKKEEEERRDKWKRILVDYVTHFCLKPSLKSFYFEFRFE